MSQRNCQDPEDDSTRIESFSSCVSPKYITARSLTNPDGLDGMIRIHEKYTSRLDPGHETHNPSADQLRSLHVSISKIYAAGDRRPSSSTGGPATNCEEAMAHARGSHPRIMGELGKVGINVAKSTVEKYMVRHRKPPSPTWRSFLKNHVGELVSIDFFVGPTVKFRLLFVLIFLAHDRRRVIGSIRRKCLDHVLVLGERHLNRTLVRYFAYYHAFRTHRSLDMDCPVLRPVQNLHQGKVVAFPEVGGIHHHYERMAA